MLVIVRQLTESLLVDEAIEVHVAGLRRKRVFLKVVGQSEGRSRSAWYEEGSNIEVKTGVVMTTQTIRRGLVSLAIDAPHTTRIRRSEVPVMKEPQP